MYGISATFGSGPIHRDVLKIIKLFAQNLRRHFFVRKRERYYILRLAHVVVFVFMSLGVTNWPLLFEIARLHHDFLL